MKIIYCYMLAGLCSFCSLWYSYFNNDYSGLLLNIIFSYSILCIACELWEINKTLKQHRR